MRTETKAASFIIVCAIVYTGAKLKTRTGDLTYNRTKVEAIAKPLFAKLSQIGSEPKPSSLTDGSRADAASGHPAAATSIDELKIQMASAQSQELQMIVSEAEAEIDKERLVQKSNDSKLSGAEADSMAGLLNRASAARLLLLERELASIEKKVSLAEGRSR